MNLCFCVHILSFIEFCTLYFPDGKRRRLLQEVNVTRAKFLTPKARKMYSSLKIFKKKTAVLSRRCLSFKARVQKAERFSATKSFKVLLSSVNSHSRSFIEAQIKNQKRHPKGYRFKTEDKILSLALFKQCGGKGYSLLSKIFALPSRRSLSKLLQKIPFHPGLNRRICSHLKATVSRMKSRDKNCVLIFDEISISPGLVYTPSNDKINGFQELGDDKRDPIFANHAIVFMLRGVHRKWKQPISFMFVHSTTKTSVLVKTLKEIIKSVFETGLNVVATICDQGSTNVSAINWLCRETNAECLRSGRENRHNGFEIDGRIIIPLYDPPHLLKGIRNNMLKANLNFKMDGKVKTAKWSHVVDFYMLDRNDDDDRRMCPKLTDEHVMTNKIRKMKVKCCAQVFSQRVSSLMRRLAQWSGKLPNSFLLHLSLSELCISPVFRNTEVIAIIKNRVHNSNCTVIFQLVTSIL